MYGSAAQEVDDFVNKHPDFLVLVAAGTPHYTHTHTHTHTINKLTKNAGIHTNACTVHVEAIRTIGLQTNSNIQCMQACMSIVCACVLCVFLNVLRY
jgi:hypothetical protein